MLLNEEEEEEIPQKINICVRPHKNVKWHQLTFNTNTDENTIQGQCADEFTRYIEEDGASSRVNDWEQKTMGGDDILCLTVIDYYVTCHHVGMLLGTI